MSHPFADRIAPIAISMTVVGPGTIGAHPWAGMEWRAAASRFFDSRCKAGHQAGGGKKRMVDVAELRSRRPFAAGLRSDQINRVRVGRDLISWNQDHGIMATIGAFASVNKGIQGSRNTGSASFRPLRVSADRDCTRHGPDFRCSRRHRVRDDLGGQPAWCPRRSTRLDDPALVIELVWMARDGSTGLVFSPVRCCVVVRDRHRRSSPDGFDRQDRPNAANPPFPRSRSF